MIEAAHIIELETKINFGLGDHEDIFDNFGFKTTVSFVEIMLLIAKKFAKNKSLNSIFDFLKKWHDKLFSINPNISDYAYLQSKPSELNFVFNKKDEIDETHDKRMKKYELDLKSMKNYTLNVKEGLSYFDADFDKNLEHDF